MGDCEWILYRAARTGRDSFKWQKMSIAKIFAPSLNFFEVFWKS